MKTMVVYSSKTGNTKKVAEAVYKVMPERCEIYSVKTAPDPESYDFIAFGYWVDKGGPDSKSLEYMKKIAEKKVAIFATLGAYPDSIHALECINAGKNILEGNTVLGDFICQGRIDPALTEWMEKLPPDHPHAPDEARRKRWKDAETHPDEEDLDRAADVFKGIVARL